MNLPRSGLLLGFAIGAILSVVFFAGFTAGAVFTRPSSDVTAAGSDQDLKDFLTAYHLVTDHSYFRPLNKHRLVYAAIDGMLEATGDPHTLFLSPTENQAANSEINGSGFSGIGAIVVPAHRTLQVVAPIPNEPAARAGLKAGDVITAINGSPVSRISGDTAIARIHGRAGTVVRLTVIRGHSSPFTVGVRRARIAPITAYGRMLAGKIGYVQIISFGDNTAEQVQQALAVVGSHHARALILDLRDNPGGYVDAAQHVVSSLVAKGIVAYEQDRSHHLQPLPVLTDQKHYSLPIVALVNGGTASAAEITAGALHDYGRAVLLGTRTYGKGSMQSVYSLPDGSSVRITDRLWLTPHKHSIQGVGIRPDLVIEETQAQAAQGQDPQLEAAERYLAAHKQ